VFSCHNDIELGAVGVLYRYFCVGVCIGKHAVICYGLHVCLYVAC